MNWIFWAACAVHVTVSVVGLVQACEAKFKASRATDTAIFTANRFERLMHPMKESLEDAEKRLENERKQELLSYMNCIARKCEAETDMEKVKEMSKVMACLSEEVRSGKKAKGLFICDDWNEKNKELACHP